MFLSQPPVVAASSWCPVACRCITPVPTSVITWCSPWCLSHMLLSVCLCPNFSSYLDTRHWIQSTLIQCDLQLT